MALAADVFHSILAEYQVFRASNPKAAWTFSIPVPYPKEAHRIRMLFYRFRKADRIANESLPPDDPLWGASAFDPFIVRILTYEDGTAAVEFANDLLANVTFTFKPTK